MESTPSVEILPDLLKAPLIFGAFFVVVGLLGFHPQYTTNNLLFDTITADFMHNTLHIVIGILAITAAARGRTLSRIYLILAGIFFATLAIVGYYNGEGTLYGVVSINMNDDLFRAAVAIVALFFGLALK